MIGRSDRVTILYVHSSADLYGSDRCLLDLVTRLDKEQFRPVVVVPFPGALSEELEKAGVSTVLQDPWVLRKTLVRSGAFARYCLTLPHAVRSLMTVIRNEGARLVHSNSGVVLGGALAAKFCGIPHVWHLREFFSGYPMLWPVYARLMSALSDKVVCISKAVASQMPAAALTRTDVVYDGIDCGSFHAGAGGESGRVRKVPVIANIGRVSEIKGQDVFIRAAADVLKIHPRARFLIIGDVFPGHEGFLAKLKNLVGTLALDSHVEFTGFRRDVPSLLRNIDIVALTTRIPEGLGLSLLESMACGKPVIATTGGGSEEAVKRGLTGLLIPPGDFRALAGAIIRLLNSGDLMAGMGENGKTWVRERFSIERTASTIQRIYDDILPGPND